MDVHANWRMPARAFFTSNIDEVNLDLAWIFVNFAWILLILGVDSYDLVLIFLI